MVTKATITLKGNGGWGEVVGGKKKVQELLWTELDFAGILSLQHKQQRACSSLLLFHHFSCHPPFPIIPYRLNFLVYSKQNLLNS